MEQSYRTIRKEASDEMTEKKSRFIATARPVWTDGEAAEFIDRVRKQYRDATHNVYAYLLRDGRVERFSDDGEPGGTAGVPILDVMKKEGLTDVAVVVTRYFGGILLGAGGLVRAYGKAGRLGLLAAGIATLAPCRLLELRCAYDQYGKLDYYVKSGGWRQDETVYDDAVTLRFWVPAEDADRVARELVDLTGGASVPRQTALQFMELPS